MKDAAIANLRQAALFFEYAADRLEADDSLRVFYMGGDCFTQSLNDGNVVVVKSTIHQQWERVSHKEKDHPLRHVIIEMEDCDA